LIFLLFDVFTYFYIYKKTFIMALKCSEVTSSIDVCYNTGGINVKFNILFGEGNDDEDEYERKNFTKNYSVELFKNDDSDASAVFRAYRVVGNEGPFVIKIKKLDINSSDGNSNYDYALGFAVDNDKPEYRNDNSTIPYNIERDGGLWTIPAHSQKENNFDQNPHGKFQWVMKKAKDINYKPTEEEKELGMEETSEDTGLIYLTFMVFKKRKQVQESVTRGTTRGTTRGITQDDTQLESHAARFGYGNSVSSSSVKSEFTFAEGTERYVLPVRLRISKESKESDINCSKHIKGATLNMLRQQTAVVPF
jgi:hypothetical protein